MARRGRAAGPVVCSGKRVAVGNGGRAVALRRACRNRDARFVLVSCSRRWLHGDGHARGRTREIVPRGWRNGRVFGLFFLNRSPVSRCCTSVCIDAGALQLLYELLPLDAQGRRRAFCRLGAVQTILCAFVKGDANIVKSQKVPVTSKDFVCTVLCVVQPKVDKHGKVARMVDEIG